jgi:hypothetical protein
MSDTNRVRMSFIEEVTYGVTPAGNLTDFRYTGETLGQETSTKLSDEIRADRQTADVVRTMIKNAGTMNFEFIAAQHDTILQAALLSAAWSSAVTLTLTTIAATGANSFTDSANGFGVFAVGQWVKTSGFTNPANNGWFRLTSVAAGTIGVAGATATVVEAAGGSRTIIQGGQITNGTTAKSFTIEKHFTDLVNTYSVNRGMMFDQFGMKIATEEINTCNATLMGKDEANGTVSVGSGYVAANTNDVLQGIDHIPATLEGGAAAGTIGLIELGWNINNKLRGRTQIGTLGLISVGVGSIEATGNLRAYFETATLFQKYLAFTASSLAFVVNDPVALKSYVFEFPRVKYSTGKRVAGGKDQDVIADLSFNAYRDPTTGITMRISRWV